MLILSAQSIIVGIIIALFVKCIRVLLNPVNHTSRGIRWGVMIHTVMMFSFATIFVAVSFAAQPVYYVDNRKYPGFNGKGPGPVGYFANVAYFKAINLIPNTMFLLNNWLADGILVSHILNRAPRCSTLVALPALSLLCPLCRQLPGHCLPLPDVLGFYWCVLKHSANQDDIQLTSLR